MKLWKENNYMKKIIFIIFGLLLIGGNGCSNYPEKINIQESSYVDSKIDLQSKESSEIQILSNEINEIIYEDESQKTISYYNITLNLYPYHIASEITTEKITTYFCEIDLNETWMTETNMTVSVQDCSEINIDTFEEAKQYFHNMGSYYKIESYQDLSDESGIIKMYTAIGDISHYLIYYNSGIYLIESDNGTLDTDLLKRYRKNLVTEGIYHYEVECGKLINIDIKEDISYKDNKALYEVSTIEGKNIYKGELSIIREDTCKTTFCLYDSNGNQFQTLNWESRKENYPQFIDINMDGMVDIQLIVDSAPSYDICLFYVWNVEDMCYQKVEYEDTLAEIKVEDGYLLNWVKDGMDRYVIEKLIWEGNKLIKESEEVVSAD